VLLSACGGGSSTPAADVPPPAWGSAGLLIPAGQQSKVFQLGTCTTSNFDYSAENYGSSGTTYYSTQVVVSADGSMVVRASTTEGGSLTNIISVTASSMTYRGLDIEASSGKISEIEYYTGSETYAGKLRSTSSIDLGAYIDSDSEAMRIINSSGFYTNTYANYYDQETEENIYINQGMRVEECDGAMTLEALTPVYLIDEARIAKLFTQPINQIDRESFDDADARILNRNLVWNNRWRSCPQDNCTSYYGTSVNLDTAELKLGGTHSTTTGLPTTPTPITITLAKLLKATSGSGYYGESYNASTPDQQESLDLYLGIESSDDPALPRFEIDMSRVGSVVYVEYDD
jgi:hypothetical protein